MSLKEAIQHEETLIDRRLNWMLTFQGFLFASIALSSNNGIGEILVLVLPILGSLTAFTTFLSIVAAYRVIDKKREEEEKKTDPENFGGLKVDKNLGRLNSLGLPLIIFIAWLYIFIFM